MTGQRRTSAVAVAARPWVPTAAWAAVLFALGLVRMLVPRAVGLADDGSGARLACRLGVAPEGEVRYFAFAVFRYVADDDASCASGTPPPWPQHAGLLLARLVSTTLGAGALDLRVAVVAYCALAAVTAALVGALARRRRHARAVTTVLTWLLLVDSAFAGYAASLYPQAAGITGLLLTVTGWLLLEAAGPARWVGRAALTLGAAVLVSSGPVAALAVVPLGVALLLRARASARARARDRAAWLAPAALTVALTTLAAGAVAGVDPTQRRYDTWDYVSTGVLADTDRPGPELAAMGLPADAERFLGIPVWSPASIRGWDRWPDVDPDPLRVQGYVLSHPAVLHDRLDHAVRAMGEGRPASLGSYDAGTARPGEQERRVTLFSSRQDQLLAFGLPVAVLLGAVLTWLALVVTRSPVHGADARRLASGALLLLGVAVSQVAGTALTEATDAGRHVVVGSLAGLLALCLLVAAGLTSRALDASARPEVARPEAARASA
ncbi:glycan biosynthesis hexose transferase WsfD [Promicromonospora sukumoe]|uniref:glycan biosynthesis hexose transferase WsfD n=1 Tax=Promicromonospora sukumoe TaxID=88382 RepID=UPI0003A1DE5E|nr:hypothetical protein [Promicromonospora sukumoe]